MKSGKCPKCSAQEVYCLTQPSSRSALAVSTFGRVPTDEYVCAGCGYTESYVKDKAGLAKVASNGRKVRS